MSLSVLDILKVRLQVTKRLETDTADQETLEIIADDLLQIAAHEFEETFSEIPIDEVEEIGQLQDLCTSPLKPKESLDSTTVNNSSVEFSDIALDSVENEDVSGRETSFIDDPKITKLGSSPIVNSLKKLLVSDTHVQAVDIVKSLKKSSSKIHANDDLGDKVIEQSVSISKTVTN